MAVDALRETKHINRVAPKDLSVIWSAQSYRPEITLAIQKIREMNWAPLSKICLNKIGPGPHPHFADNGYPCLKTKNIMGIVINVSSIDHVDPADADRWEHYCINREDLVLNITGAGSIGRIGIYFGLDRPLTNQHLARLSVIEGIDAGYVCAFFTSWWGERIIEQGISGSTGQLNIVNDHLREMPVALPNTQVQRYIGDKVRQAERLRERARFQRASLQSLITIPIVEKALAAIDGKSSRTTTSDLSPRLDPKYYGKKSMEVLKASLQKSVLISSLVDEISNGFEHREFSIEGTTYITVGEVSGGRLTLGSAPKINISVSIPDKARINTRCVLVVRTGSIGNAVAVFDEDTHAVISSHLIRLQCESEAKAATLAAWLSSPAGRILQHKISYGAVQPQIGQEELLNLPIPSVIVDKANEILHALQTEDAAIRTASRLTTAATQLVEHLIEGKLSEADLIAAQKALDAGDRSGDRAILASLRASSAADAAPLIPDLDALYALLDADSTSGQGD